MNKPGLARGKWVFRVWAANWKAAGASNHKILLK